MPTRGSIKEGAGNKNDGEKVDNKDMIPLIDSRLIRLGCWFGRNIPGKGVRVNNKTIGSPVSRSVN